MKRVYTQFFIVLALLLCAALTLSGVAYAKYQVETPKTLTATIQNRWKPTVKEESWTSANETGATLSFSITNDTSSPKTVTIRLLTDLAPNETVGTNSELYIKINGEISYMSAHSIIDMGTELKQARGDKGYIYCADATTLDHCSQYYHAGSSYKPRVDTGHELYKHTTPGHPLRPVSKRSI